MPTSEKQGNMVEVTQYITDKRGHKVGAIIDLKELDRVRELLEDLADLKSIEDRTFERAGDYESYRLKRKARLNV